MGIRGADVASNSFKGENAFMDNMIELDGFFVDRSDEPCPVNPDTPTSAPFDPGAVT